MKLRPLSTRLKPRGDAEHNTVRHLTCREEIEMNLRSLLMLALMATIWMGGCTPTETSNTPEANAPEANAPEANAPESNAPEANASEAKAPDANAAANPDQSVSSPDASKPDAASASTAKPDAGKPDEKKPDQISDKNKPDEETGKEDLVAKANEGKNPPKPAAEPNKVTPPIKQPVKATPIENLKKQANPATKASAFVGTWRFELPADKKKEIQEAMAKMAAKNPSMKNLPIPESTITVNGDGTFTINEVLGQKRQIKGTYTVKEGMAILTYKTVNGKPPVARSDKAQHGLIITANGDLKRSDTMTFKKK